MGVRVGTNGVSASTSVSGQGCTACFSVLILIGVIGVIVRALAHYWPFIAGGAGLIAVVVVLAVVSNRKKTPPAAG